MTFVAISRQSRRSWDNEGQETEGRSAFIRGRPARIRGHAEGGPVRSKTVPKRTGNVFHQRRGDATSADAVSTDPFSLHLHSSSSLYRRAGQADPHGF